MEEENGNGNAHPGQAQPHHAATLYSTPQGPQNVQAQPATQPPREDEPDYGCWGNVLHAICCIPHARGVVPAVRSS